jgi:hypothetical protein
LCQNNLAFFFSSSISIKSLKYESDNVLLKLVLIHLSDKNDISQAEPYLGILVPLGKIKNMEFFADFCF